MLIGAMNHPASDPLAEIEWIASMNLEFVDLTLEPPATASWNVDPVALRDALRKHGLSAVGHTAYYLPIASAFEQVRRAAVCELRECVKVFQRVGVSLMNLHPDRHAPQHDRDYLIRRNLDSIRELTDFAAQHQVELMIENLPRDFNSAEQLGELLDPMPELGLHLDIGHANLETPYNTTEEILRRYGKRLRHVHLHDNRGGEDLHLPLGAGNVDVGRHLAALKACGYDRTITLEVFTRDRHFLAYSRDVLRRLWNEDAR
jgi:sugar phosphate isomerase/epimerase